MPTPTGFVTLLDVGIFFTAFIWAKRRGDCWRFVRSLIDFLLGYPQWAFFSLVFHGTCKVILLVGQVKTADWSCFGDCCIHGWQLFVASSLMYNVADAVTGLASQISYKM